ncbi:hypothetical protein GF376_04910 [Candidatus Peregrinibacteria bacterium]|nr:hypothetical protein [Candidatus Peregrinibacteria bacterium]
MKKVVRDKGCAVYTISALAAGEDPFLKGKGCDLPTIMNHLRRWMEDFPQASTRSCWNAIMHPDLGKVEWKETKDGLSLKLDGREVLRPEPGHPSSRKSASWRPPKGKVSFSKQKRVTRALGSV